MRILITGGAGCLGSNLIEHWLPQGHEVFVIDNFATGKREVVPPTTGLTVREGSVADADLVDECFAAFQPDIVVHAAAAYKDPDDWKEDVSTNVLGSVYVAQAAKKYGAGRLINFQTALCYGRPTQLPIPADHPTAPFTSYGISKTAGEQFMLLSGVPTLTLRIANVTGPRLAIGPIPTFYKRLKAGQGCFCSDTARDFLDMADFLAFMELAIQPDAPTGTFNVSSGEAHSIKEIFDLVSAYLGLEVADVPVVPPAADDVPEVALDASESLAAFGWKAKIGFADTIRRQLAWYDQYGVTDVYSHLKPQTGK
ncbi:NAD-dependent epimerase/dehydratase family protein [Bordetella bronchiseptica]|uniref:NAD-dependent epimerase/dehydratase family protein n=1 Tax=Bordetella bronchiseptica TaxID=518 RepID=UPI00028AD3EA|nr:NAD-dependent epimerase/dehydratase family protein [Bordetella bronchiseptica]KDD58724.1 NAD(P)H-binding protein, PF13460 family [Bordetella bronchiseptica OSU553]AWQ03315.1 nucleotide sugar epimerase [Bordetella bronchiseptica]KAK51631.1 NAD(P)H-binding protein, PF13460 family [Bordetella bronchiseptica OSU054]KDB78727.1 NAD(P)H-binding protein, PF13460 family [Bordetella bronchiseptica CA90 BB1334]KDD43476.1 NAD(P)H-binding protein, PF13460 family [Bordetella bronchiseptica OSU095]